MKLENIPLGATDWSKLDVSVKHGAGGTAKSRRFQAGDYQLRVVEYSEGYLSDHWCSKGHIVYVLDGELVVDQKDGARFILQTGMSYHTPEDGSPHRLLTTTGATVFIVD